MNAGPMPRTFKSAKVLALIGSSGAAGVDFSCAAAASDRQIRSGNSLMLVEYIALRIGVNRNRGARTRACRVETPLDASRPCRAACRHEGRHRTHECAG